MKIGIVGNGVVGSAIARSFLEWHEVRIYDIQQSKRTHDMTLTLESDLVFVCLPSPRKTDGNGCDTSIIESFMIGCSLHYRNANLVLKSTVPVGFTRTMFHKYGLRNLVHSPEFLTARCAITDAQLPSRNIIGTVGLINYCNCGILLRDLYNKRFTGVPVYDMTPEESEFIKLAQNSLFASKIALFNELRTYADRRGINWTTFLQGLLSDGRIAHSHTQVPGPDGQYGFGGTCLPKDLNNLIQCFEDEKLPSPVLNAVQYRNSKYDRKSS